MPATRSLSELSPARLPRDVPRGHSASGASGLLAVRFLAPARPEELREASIERPAAVREQRPRAAKRPSVFPGLPPSSAFGRPPPSFALGYAGKPVGLELARFLRVLSGMRFPPTAFGGGPLPCRPPAPSRTLSPAGFRPAGPPAPSRRSGFGAPISHVCLELAIRTRAGWHSGPLRWQTAQGASRLALAPPRESG
jgi:hypothetical protein